MAREMGKGTGLGDAPAAPAVGWPFVASYAAAYLATSLVLIAPLLVTLALKVESLVGPDRAPADLALVAATGSLLSMVANPLFGRLSDRTTSRFGMRRPWMLAGLGGGFLGTLVVAVAPTIGLVLAGWCLTQLSFNAMLAAVVAVLPDQVPVSQRGTVAGVLGVCLPVASVGGTYVVDVFSPNQVGMFLGPCVLGGVLVVLFAATFRDRTLDPADRPPWSSRRLLETYYVSPRRHPDFAWVFVSRFLFISAYAFLVTYQAYYLTGHLGVADEDVSGRIFTATLVQAAGVVVATLVGGRLSDRVGRRKPFVTAAALGYGGSLLLIAFAATFHAFLVGMALGGLGFGLYLAVDLALVADVLPGSDTVAKDLGVLNIAGALPFSVAPAVAPAVLWLGGGSYQVLYVVAGLCAVAGAVAIVPVRRVR